MEKRKICINMAVVAQSSRPLQIAVSYVMDASNVPQAYSDEIHRLALEVTRALLHVADDVQVLATNAEEVPGAPGRFVQKLDGIVLLGGADVDPVLYTDDPMAIALADVNHVNRRADHNEIELVHAASEDGVPLLGICRGMQLINVALGGTLVPDLGEDTMHNTRQGGNEMTDHEVALLDGSGAQSIFGLSRLKIRSAHHQAVQRLGRGLKLVAKADDGVVEAYESEPASTSWILGVQWHPEAPGANPRDLDLLAAAFIDAARLRRGTRPKD